MAKVEVIASTIRYGSNGFKHKGEVFNLPDEVAKEKAAAGLVKIIPSPQQKGAETKKAQAKKTKVEESPVNVTEPERSVTVHPDVKEALKGG